MGESAEEGFKRWLRDRFPDGWAAEAGLAVRSGPVYDMLRAAYFGGVRFGFSSPAPTRPEQVRLEDELDEFERSAR